jgi:hypothetical protein
MWFGVLLSKFDFSLKVVIAHGIVTTNGFLGLGPSHIEKDDIVCVMLGASVPYVLRRQSETRFQFRGTAYVREAMKGEALAGYFYKKCLSCNKSRTL